MTKRFTIDGAIGYAFRKLKEEWSFLILVLLVYGLVVFLPSILFTLIQHNSPEFKSAAGSIIALFVPFQILAVMGLTGISLDLHDKKPHRIADLFAPYMLFFDYVFAAILYSLIVFAGLVLGILPGIYWGIRLSFFSFVIMDTHCGPIDALKKSFAITKGEVLHLILFQICFGVLTFVSLVIPLLGILIVSLTGVLASAYVYRRLLQNENVLSKLTA